MKDLVVFAGYKQRQKAEDNMPPRLRNHGFGLFFFLRSFYLEIKANML